MNASERNVRLVKQFDRYHMETCKPIWDAFCVKCGLPAAHDNYTLCCWCQVAKDLKL